MDPGVPVPSKDAPDDSDWTHTFEAQIPLTVGGKPEKRLVPITYDLSSLPHESTIYMINDTASGVSDDRFYFNIGGTLDSALLPSACHKVKFPCDTLDDPNLCDEIIANQTDGVDGTFGLDPGKQGYAFKYTKSKTGNPDDDDCILLGTKLETPMSLYDTEDNYAHGVNVQYIDGSYRKAYDNAGVPYGKNCEFSLDLICPLTRKTYSESTTEDVHVK